MNDEAVAARARACSLSTEMKREREKAWGRWLRVRLHSRHHHPSHPIVNSKAVPDLSPCVLVRESCFTGASGFSTRREVASNAPNRFLPCYLPVLITPSSLLCLDTPPSSASFALFRFSLSLSLFLSPVSCLTLSTIEYIRLRVSLFPPFLYLPSLARVIARRLIVRLLSRRSRSGVSPFSLFLP